MSIVTIDQLIEGLEQIAEGESVTTGLSENWFAMLVDYCSESRLVELPCRKEVSAYLKENFEVPYKEKNGESPTKLGKYRSNKSVISKAIEMNISLYRGDGTAKGKTELEQEMKEAQPEKSVDDKIADLASTISKLLDKGEHTSVTGELLVNLGIKASS